MTDQTSDTGAGASVLSELLDDGVLLLTLNRPDRLNAFTIEMGERYFALLDEAAADPAVRVIVVTGAGKGFCAGADMDSLGEIGSSAEEANAVVEARPPMDVTLVPKPMIAAVNGAAAGMGLVHALMCDVRFAAAGAKLTTAFARRGLIAEHGSSWVLSRLVGLANAADLLLSARVVLAEEAASMGLVNRVVAPDELLPAAIAYAADLARNCSPTSMAVMKRQIWGDTTVTLDQSSHEAVRLMGESFARPDFIEGVASYVERRPPRFPPVASGA